MNFCVAILILKMEEEKHFQYIVPFYFKKGKNATETKICAVYGDGAVTDRNILQVVCKVSYWRFLTG